MPKPRTKKPKRQYVAICENSAGKVESVFTGTFTEAMNSARDYWLNVDDDYGDEEVPPPAVIKILRVSQ